MSKTPRQIEAAITRLMLQTSANELALCAMASMLTVEQMGPLRDRMAALAVLQEVADGERSTALAQELLQPALDRLHQRMQLAHRKYQAK